MSSGSVGLEALGAEGPCAVGMVPALRPARVSSFSLLLWTLFPEPRWGQGGGGAPAFPRRGPGGALSPGNLWAGRRQASLCLWTELEPGSAAAGGQEPAGEAGDVVWGAGQTTSSGRPGVPCGVGFVSGIGVHVPPCGILGVQGGGPAFPTPAPSSCALRGWGGLPCSVPLAVSEVLGVSTLPAPPPPGGAEA